MITILTLPAPNGTLTVTYCDRRGLLDFRKGGRSIATEYTDKNLSRPEARKIAIQALSEQQQRPEHDQKLLTLRTDPKQAAMSVLGFSLGMIFTRDLRAWLDRRTL